MEGRKVVVTYCMTYILHFNLGACQLIPLTLINFWPPLFAECKSIYDYNFSASHLATTHCYLHNSHSWLQQMSDLSVAVIVTVTCSSWMYLFKI